MRDPYQYPKLRWPIDLRLQKIGNEEVLYIGCPLGVSQAPLALIAAVAPIVSCFEGRLSVQQITEQFKPYGVELPLIQKLVTMLDENLFLESPKFFAAEKAVREQFKQASVRSPALAGLGYSGSKSDLEKEVERYLELGRKEKKIEDLSEPLRLDGVVAPHIDYRRGKLGYGIAYNQLPRESYDLIVMFGTAHQYSKRLFHLTAKDFETPLGTLQCDRQFILKLGALYGADRAFADEILHRREHSLELQTPFLAHLNPRASIVPILVGSFYNFMQEQREPQGVEEYDSFVAGLTECVRDAYAAGKRVCFVAGVDLAHLGRQFGDREPLTDEVMQKAAERDSLFLRSLESLSPKAIFAHIAEDSDARRICGFPALYTLADLLARLERRFILKVFDYRQAVDYNNDCAVTFASAGLYSR